MNAITNASSTIFDVIIEEDADALQDLSLLTPRQKTDLFKKLAAVQLVINAAYGTKKQIVKAQARRNNVSEQSINGWIGIYTRCGFRGLIDGRRAVARARAALPDVTRQWIKDEILRCPSREAAKEVHRTVVAQWNLWRRTGDPNYAIPGFITPPADAGKGYPAGFSIENFRSCKPTNYQKTLAAQGTIAAYRLLPSILSTCVGTKYLEYVFFDDEKPDVQVRVSGYDRPMVPLCFHALDRLTRYPFRPHVRLRWYDCDAKQHKHLTQKEFVWYEIYQLQSAGYRTDEVGTTHVVEHGTAAAWSNQKLITPDGFHSFEDAVRSLTSRDGNPGVRIDTSGLFNKPAFTEMLYGPQSSGNPRFKAPIESSFRLWRIYSQHLIGQTGSNVENAPEENYGITKYEKRILKLVKDLPQSIQDGIQSNYLTGIEFGSLVECIRHALANRDDHNFEGWDECRFVEPMWRWEEDEVDMWRTRSQLANLPEHLKEMALHQQSQNPRLTKLQPWTPELAKMACENDPAIARLSIFDSIHLIPTSWAKPVKVTNRHQIELTEELLPGMELIYLPEITTIRGRTEYLQTGDEVMIYLNPLMPDQVIVCDMDFQPRGTLTRNIRTGRNNDQVEMMFKQRARLQVAMEAPVRRAMQPVSDRRDAVATMNRDLIDRALGKTPAGSPEARSEAAQKGARTAAANRVRKLGNETDFDEYVPVMQPSAFSELPDEEEIPEGF